MLDYLFIDYNPTHNAIFYVQNQSRNWKHPQKELFTNILGYTRKGFHAFSCCPAAIVIFVLDFIFDKVELSTSLWEIYSDYVFHISGNLIVSGFDPGHNKITTAQLKKRVWAFLLFDALILLAGTVLLTCDLAIFITSNPSIITCFKSPNKTFPTCRRLVKVANFGGKRRFIIEESNKKIKVKRVLILTRKRYGPNFKENIFLSKYNLVGREKSQYAATGFTVHDIDKKGVLIKNKNYIRKMEEWAKSVYND